MLNAHPPISHSWHPQTTARSRDRGKYNREPHCCCFHQRALHPILHGPTDTPGLCLRFLLSRSPPTNPRRSATVLPTTKPSLAVLLDGLLSSWPSKKNPAPDFPHRA